MARLVLASTSRYRADVLRRIGVPFDTVSPEVEEVIPPGATPYAAASLLARQKALAVSSRPAFRDALVIGSDQICVAPDGEILGKPGRVDRALAQLKRLQGATHRLITAVAVARLDEVHSAIDVHTLTMHPLSDADLSTYLARDQPLDCAGSYRLEASGIALFSRIEADPEFADETAIIGLPVMKTLRLLREHYGWTIFERGDAA